MALLGVAFTTTAVAKVANANEPEQSVDDPSSEGSTDTETPPDQPATLPTGFRLQDDAVTAVVPLTPHHPPAAAHQGLSPAAYGLWIGALGGAVLGAANDHDARTLMDPDSCRCAVLPGVLIGSLIGLGVGALVGVLSGPGDSP